MLKILIIDDDILTRKGIQMLMPWAAHNMEIVGEASNGKEALAFLAQHPDIDLALVDLDMPVMDGTAFIQAASSLYPKLSYVVLTVHMEFEYVQQILRLGAIDYISKTQFDEENFDEILDRIQAGIAKKNTLTESFADWKKSKILSDWIYALISIQQENSSIIQGFETLNGLSPEHIHGFNDNIWIIQTEKTKFLFPENFSNTMLLEISDVYEMTYSHLGRLLNRYLKEQFFYDYRPVLEVNHKHAYELEETPFIEDEKTFEFMKEEWSSLNWVHENGLFDQFRLSLKNCRLKPSQLYHFLLNLEIIWNSSYCSSGAEPVTLPPSFSNWQEVEEWLTHIYEKSQLFCSDAKYSADVIKNIQSAKIYIDQHYSSTLSATEIARTSGMSYSYFSRCFHDVIGESFSDYCTHVRISHAKQMLLNTGKSIQEIAFSVGYQDEKYFSRIFKKVTGTSPSDFRKDQ